MNFYVMTLFPEMIMNGLNESITGRAIKKGIISVEAVNIRDYTLEKHGKTDDYPFGGGAGMVMQVQPIDDCFRAVADRIDSAKKPKVLYMSPQGRRFDQKMAEELSKEDDIIFLCGHYEGIDERALEITGSEEVSLGDFVLTGGEYPAMVMIDCISRLIPGVLGKDFSAEIESFHDNLLEYPQYSRPENYKNMKVPEILLSGHHANVEKWRREQSIIRTLEKRPDLLKDAVLSDNEKKFLEKLLREREADSKKMQEKSQETETGC